MSYIPKIKSAFFTIGRFLRLIDENDQLSLTNVILMGVAIKIFAAQDVSVAELGALVMSLLAYAHKKSLGLKVKIDKTQTKAIDELKQQIQGAVSQITVLTTASEETRQGLNSIKLKQGLSR